MSKTIVLSPSNGRKKAVETFRLQNPTTNGSSSTVTPTATGTVPCQPKSSTAEEWETEERADAAKTPSLGDIGEEREGQPLECKLKPHKAPLSMAIAMKVGTSPAIVSCFPDSFWIPFLEQDEYDKQKIAQSSRRRHGIAHPAADFSMIPTPRNLCLSGKSPIFNNEITREATSLISIASILRFCVTILVYLTMGLMMASLVDVPYFGRILEDIAICGRVAMGFAFWIYGRAYEFFPWLCNLYHQHLKDTVEDMMDWIALRL